MNNSQTVVRQMIAEKEAAEKNVKGWQAEVIRITNQLSNVIDPIGILQYAGKLEEGGATTQELDGGKFTIEADKKVKWEGPMLQDIATHLDWPTVARMFKISFSMTEKEYKVLVDNVKAGLVGQELLDKVNEARTVSVGEAKIKKAELLPLD